MHLSGAGVRDFAWNLVGSSIDLLMLPLEQAYYFYPKLAQNSRDLGDYWCGLAIGMDSRSIPWIVYLLLAIL